MGLLKDVKVVDFTKVLTGPFCTQMLAELGAEVIKIEAVGKGDETREWDPIVNGWSGYFGALNRSKRSITLNLKHEKAKEIVERLVKKCDVVVENFAPGVAERLGISYEQLKKINPNLIYLSISAYGQNGPNRHVKGYDPMIQADAGAMSITGNKGGPPVKNMIPIADLSSGMYGAFAIVSALYNKSKTQRGEYIDVSLYDSVVSLMGIIAADYFYTGNVPEPLGSEHLYRVPSKNYITGDGTFIHLVCNNAQWQKLCDLLELDDRFKKAPYDEYRGRYDCREEINETIEKHLSRKPGEVWVNILQKNGVPCAAVNKIDRVLTSPQTKFRQNVIEWEQEEVGIAKGINYPYKFLFSESKIQRPVPKIGEHTREVLLEYGFTEDQINEFKEENIIG
jgi:crotonobetainyl-CoA:carnitine CoA-transferase CaiB-like acyl-CoA transferase